MSAWTHRLPNPLWLLPKPLKTLHLNAFLTTSVSSQPPLQGPTLHPTNPPSIHLSGTSKTSPRDPSFGLTLDQMLLETEGRPCFPPMQDSGPRASTPSWLARECPAEMPVRGRVNQCVSMNTRPHEQRRACRVALHWLESLLAAPKENTL